MKSVDILTIGSITTDIFVRPCQLPTFEKDGKEFFAVEVGEKIKLDDVFRSGGGSAANSGIGFVKMGFSVEPIGVIGDDEEGEHVRHKFKELGISTDGLVVEPNHSSSISFILNACDGKRTVLHHRSTSSKFNASVLKNAPKARCAYVGHLYPDAEGILAALPSWKMSTGGIIAWNPGKTQFKKGVGTYKDLLENIDILILNTEEAEQFLGKEAPHIPLEDVTEEVCGKVVPFYESVERAYQHDVRELGRAFLSMGVKQVVITDGQRGAHIFDINKEHYHIVTKKDLCVSTLGAGDAFSVGCVSALLEGRTIAELLQWGSICATNVVKEFGAQHGYVTKLDVEAEVLTL